ncbi:armadillo-type protein [Coprinopsis sp. MPI-PUGE-AT-0042]|nr:armadillo-type protein [Coprinopsis sp. MPI-PUGE-AT-0042]
MFKGILPSKRSSASDFTVLTPLDVGKENLPWNGQTATTASKGGRAGGLIQTKKKRSASKKRQEEPLDLPETNVAFDKLLDELQIPPSLRPKLLGMDSTVKAEMIRSSQVLVLNPPQWGSPPQPPATPPRGTESLSSPRPAFLNEVENKQPPPSAGVSGAYVSAHNSPYASNRSRQGSGHFRGASLFSRSQSNLGSNLASMSNLDLAGSLKPTKDKTATVKQLSPMRFCSMLQGQSSLHIDVEDIKKLRLMLRNESASWTEEFCTLGGYSALLTRLNEVLEVEWREEQHDDKVLHELLRCFKALSTSSIGCFALRSSCPTPWAQLITLLYSDKKPGEVATRQLILDLFHILFELYPPSSLPSRSRKNSAISRHSEAWEMPSAIPTSNVITLPAPHQSVFSFVRSLLLTPAPPPTEAPGVPVSPHEFIESLHVPRIYKSYLQEMSDVCRDYFWVFCHPNNTIWILSETDESRVEKPKAPSGMTGGVEFEAICYFTTHLKFINMLASSVADSNVAKDHELSAWRFHSDLFLSGLERILLISRKASTTYYPTLHLEISRYINHAIKAGYALPYTISRLIGSPPSGVVKAAGAAPSSGHRSAASSASRAGQAPTTPTKSKQTPNFLPSPRKVDPMKFD